MTPNPFLGVIFHWIGGLAACGARLVRRFSSWTMHMASIIIFSTLWGIALREWKGTSRRTHLLIAAGLTVLVASTVIVDYGSFLKATPKLELTNLSCEYDRDPLGVDVAAPRLAWQMLSEKRGAHQTAYHLLVASSEEMLAQERGDLWDTGKVFSDESIQHPYAGKELRSSQQVFWKVCIWDENGKPSWSRAATWTMGVMQRKIGARNGSAVLTRTSLRCFYAASFP